MNYHLPTEPSNSKHINRLSQPYPLTMAKHANLTPYITKLANLIPKYYQTYQPYRTITRNPSLSQRKIKLTNLTTKTKQICPIYTLPKVI